MDPKGLEDIRGFHGELMGFRSTFSDVENIYIDIDDYLEKDVVIFFRVRYPELFLEREKKVYVCAHRIDELVTQLRAEADYIRRRVLRARKDLNERLRIKRYENL